MVDKPSLRWHAQSTHKIPGHRHFKRRWTQCNTGRRQPAHFLSPVYFAYVMCCVVSGFLAISFFISQAILLTSMLFVLLHIWTLSLIRPREPCAFWSPENNWSCTETFYHRHSWLHRKYVRLRFLCMLRYIHTYVLFTYSSAFATTITAARLDPRKSMIGWRNSASPSPGFYKPSL